MYIPWICGYIVCAPRTHGAFSLSSCREWPPAVGLPATKVPRAGWSVSQGGRCEVVEEVIRGGRCRNDGRGNPARGRRTCRPVVRLLSKGKPASLGTDDPQCCAALHSLVGTSFLKYCIPGPDAHSRLCVAERHLERHLGAARHHAGDADAAAEQLVRHLHEHTAECLAVYCRWLLPLCLALRVR